VYVLGYGFFFYHSEAWFKIKITGKSMQDTHPHTGNSDPEIDAAMHKGDSRSVAQLSSGFLDGNDAK
jgi:hypothetical protein